MVGAAPAGAVMGDLLSADFLGGVELLDRLGSLRPSAAIGAAITSEIACCSWSNRGLSARDLATSKKSFVLVRGEGGDAAAKVGAAVGASPTKPCPRCCCVFCDPPRSPHPCFCEPGDVGVERASDAPGAAAGVDVGAAPKDSVVGGSACCLRTRSLGGVLLFDGLGSVKPPPPAAVAGALAAWGSVRSKKPSFSDRGKGGEERVSVPAGAAGAGDAETPSKNSPEGASVCRMRGRSSGGVALLDGFGSCRAPRSSAEGAACPRCACVFCDPPRSPHPCFCEPGDVGVERASDAPGAAAGVDVGAAPKNSVVGGSACCLRTRSLGGVLLFDGLGSVKPPPPAAVAGALAAWGSVRSKKPSFSDRGKGGEERVSVPAGAAGAGDAETPSKNSPEGASVCRMRGRSSGGVALLDGFGSFRAPRSSAEGAACPRCACVFCDPPRSPDPCFCEPGDVGVERASDAPGAAAGVGVGAAPKNSVVGGSACCLRTRSLGGVLLFDGLGSVKPPPPAAVAAALAAWGSVRSKKPSFSYRGEGGEERVSVPAGAAGAGDAETPSKNSPEGASVCRMRGRSSGGVALLDGFGSFRAPRSSAEGAACPRCACVFCDPPRSPDPCFCEPGDVGVERASDAPGAAAGVGVGAAPKDSVVGGSACCLRTRSLGGVLLFDGLGSVSPRLPGAAALVLSDRGEALLAPWLAASRCTWLQPQPRLFSRHCNNTCLARGYMVRLARHLLLRCREHHVQHSREADLEMLPRASRKSMRKRACFAAERATCCVRNCT